MFVADLMSHVLKLAAYCAVSATLVYSRQYLRARGLLTGEFLALLLFAMLGMMVMISAPTTSSRSTSAWSCCRCRCTRMVALHRDSARATEAAMKYFVLGALASGLLLYGMSMLYGATGTLDAARRRASSIGELANARRSTRSWCSAWCSWWRASPSSSAWCRSTCGSPTSTTARPRAMTLFIGSAPKLAAFAMAMRLLVERPAGPRAPTGSRCW